MACSSIIIGGPIDGWAPLAKYWGSGRRAPMIDAVGSLQYTECRNGAQTRQTVFTILCHQLPVTIGYLRDAVSN